MSTVAMINTVCSGSHGRIMLDLKSAAQQAGLEVQIAYGRGTPRDAKALRIGGQMDVYAHVLFTRLLDRHALGSRRATQGLIEQLRTLKPDLIHLHNLHGYYLNAPMLFDYFDETRIPVIWTMHDCWAFTGHCSHFVRANCSRWKTGCHDCPLKTAYPASNLLDNSKNNWLWKRDAFASLENLTIVSPSRWLAHCLEDSFFEQQEIRVIENGVDLSLFVPHYGKEIRKKLGIGAEKKLLLAVAAPFDERKGFGDVLEVARRTRGRAVVVMVGLDEKQMRQLPENVIGIRRTDGPEELAALYAEADCLINPTYEDTYPTVNMEAVACGTPAAAYNVGGCTEQLQGEHGRLVSVGNAQALAEAAMELAGRKEELRDVCRQWAEKWFDRRNCLEAYKRLYVEKIKAERRILR